MAKLKAEEEAKLKAEAEAKLKAEEEARLKAEAEEAAKIAAQKAEEQKLKDKEEVYSKIGNIEVLYNGVIAMNYSRDNGFGAHIDKMMGAMNSAKNAMDDKEYSFALSFIKTVQEEINWIDKNAPLRDEYNKLIPLVKKAKTESEELEAMNLAAVLYNKAESSLSDAGNQVAKFDFASAVESLKAAQSNYEAAAVKAKGIKIDQLKLQITQAVKNARFNEARGHAESLRVYDEQEADSQLAMIDKKEKEKKVADAIAEAERYQAAKDYQAMLDAAETALSIDSGNAKANSLKEEAENNLLPRVRFNPTVKGNSVVASIRFNNIGDESSSNAFTLEKGLRYSGEIVYKSGEDLYTAPFDFNCNWVGLVEMPFVLKKKEIMPKEFVINDVKFEMMPIEAGSFVMGSPEDEDGRENDELLHRVTLTKDFYMGKYEVTQEQWEAVMGNNPSYFKGAKRPVEQVSWNDAQEFIKKLNAQDDVKRNGMKFRLPTEAEWEYACRAGTTTAYSWGNTLNGDKANCNGNYPCGTELKGTYLKRTTDVGSYAPNAWGLYDMHGNVYEWCEDWYGSYDNGAVTDPKGAPSGSYRVLRGGSWSNLAWSCRSADRGNSGPTCRYFNFGFRLVLAPVQ